MWADDAFARQFFISGQEGKKWGDSSCCASFSPATLFLCPVALVRASSMSPPCSPGAEKKRKIPARRGNWLFFVLFFVCRRRRCSCRRHSCRVADFFCVRETKKSFFSSRCPCEGDRRSLPSSSMSSLPLPPPPSRPTAKRQPPLTESNGGAGDSSGSSRSTAGACSSRRRGTGGGGSRPSAAS